jgi:predicted nicotinamide N-methyase
MANRAAEKEISGQKLWCGSLVVINYMLKHYSLHLNENTVVIELGAGTGVLGMICKRLGALKVILTDNDMRSITHMNDDCIRNNIDADIKVLDWYNPIEDINSFELDKYYYNNNNIVIVAGDVLYKKMLIEPFFNTIIPLLEIRNSSMFLCHVPRANNQHEDIIEAAINKNINIIEIDRELWGIDSYDIFQYCPTEDLERAKLYRLSK